MELHIAVDVPYRDEQPNGEVVSMFVGQVLNGRHCVRPMMGSSDDEMQNAKARRSVVFRKGFSCLCHAKW